MSNQSRTVGKEPGENDQISGGRLNTSFPSSRIILLLLMVLQAATLFPFRFTTGMEERDSYRMLLGMLDGVARGAHFASPLLYNREVSFGYYALIYGLSSPSAYSPEMIISMMNAVSFLAAILFVIPFFQVLERLFDRQVAIAGCIVLAVLPVWWNAGLYGHPIMPAMLLFFTALAVLAKSALRKKPLMEGLLVTLLLALALTFRFDLMLLVPALAAVVWYRRGRVAAACGETAIYTLGAFAVFKIAQHLLPTVRSGPQPESILTLLERFQNVSQMSGHLHETLRTALVIMCQGFTPLLLALAVAAFWLVVKRRDLAQVLFTAGVILPNVVFWIPNPFPARHYLPMAPALSAAAALSICWLLAKSMRLSGRHWAFVTQSGWLAGGVLAVCTIAVSLVLPRAKGIAREIKSPFVRRFSLDQERIVSSRIAADLISIQQSPQPILVLCDSNFVIAQMELLSHNVAAEPHWFRSDKDAPFLFHEVHHGAATFVMLEQSWDPAQVKVALDQQDLYPGDPVLVDPYSPEIAYAGPRVRAHLQKTSSGESIAY